MLTTVQKMLQRWDKICGNCNSVFFFRIRLWQVYSTINKYVHTAHFLMVLLKIPPDWGSIINLLKYLKGFWFCVAVHKVAVPWELPWNLLNLWTLRTAGWFHRPEESFSGSWCQEKGIRCWASVRLFKDWQDAKKKSFFKLRLRRKTIEWRCPKCLVVDFWECRGGYFLSFSGMSECCPWWTL